MTSTNITVGLRDNKRSTRQVMKPPGGPHSDIFGVPEPALPQPRRPTAVSQIFGGEQETTKQTSSKWTKSSIVLGDEDNGNKNPSVVTTEQLVTCESNSNIIKTPEKVVVDNENESKNTVEKPKRVPPGGFSQALW